MRTSNIIAEFRISIKEIQMQCKYRDENTHIDQAEQGIKTVVHDRQE